jgi:hypothetical protein
LLWRADGAHWHIAAIASGYLSVLARQLMTALRLPTIVTLLRLAGDGDSDDGALRRERRRDIDPPVSSTLLLFAWYCLARTSRGPPVRSSRRGACRSVGMIVTSAVIVFQSP